MMFNTFGICGRSAGDCAVLVAEIWYVCRLAPYGCWHSWRVLATLNEIRLAILFVYDGTISNL